MTDYPKKKLKHIKNPKNPDHYIAIPVTYEQDFGLMADQAQEWVWYIDNTDLADRTVKVVTVTDQSGNGGDIQVERIQRFKTFAMADQAQAWEAYMHNEDDPPQHAKTHVVRYYKDNDRSSQDWVDIQYIDMWDELTMADQAQETEDFFKQPQDGDDVDTSLDTYPDFDSIDPPYRLDPWQNIIAINWGDEIPSSDLFPPQPIVLSGVIGGFGVLASFFDFRFGNIGSPSQTPVSVTGEATLGGDYGVEMPGGLPTSGAASGAGGSMTCTFSWPSGSFFMTADITSIVVMGSGPHGAVVYPMTAFSMSSTPNVDLGIGIGWGYGWSFTATYSPP
jgi:hypothetical protein